MSSQTYKNYSILVRAQTVQIFSITIFLLIPYLIHFFLHMSQANNASMIALLMYFPRSYHLLVEILALFYFVKPYREFFWKFRHTLFI